MSSAGLEGRARSWLAGDPDPETRAELEDLLERADEPGLADRFGATLSFGTAGLRGPLGAGPNRMNRVVVRQASAGLAGHLGRGATVVVGHDARHKSAVFALDAARVLAGAGLRPMVLPADVPTPLVAFAIRHHGADAGVMVTASHNPRSDNGYKVFLGDGAQIIPPVDEQIAVAIGRAGLPGNRIPLADESSPTIVRLDRSTVDAYVDWAAGTVAAGPRAVSVVYTPLHGVGGDYLPALFRRAGFASPRLVEEQARPDPDFPTVTFPNPEESGALDLARKQAARDGADLVLANDPDADRLGVVVPDGDGWRELTGDEIGALLAQHVLETTSGPGRLVVTTVVSSPLLRLLAADAGVDYVETLPGFKWVVRPGLDQPSRRFVFGYEEALGYSVAEYVRDKDGLTAALAFASLAARTRVEGATVLDRLEGLARRFGLHAGHSWSVRDPSRDAILARLRDEPPSELAGRSVEALVDYRSGGDLPSADVVRLDLEGGGRVVVRPSGTEPKLKIYQHLVVDVGDQYEHARRRADAELARLRTAIAAHLGLG